MTDHELVIKNYVNAVYAVSDLFGKNRDRMPSFGEFSIAMQKEVLATKAYIESLKEQRFFVPAGLEAHNDENAKLYFPNGISAV